jgi:hypothetical protein
VVVPLILAVTGVHTPGTVVTLLVGLEILVLALQLQRVNTVTAAVWL